MSTEDEREPGIHEFRNRLFWRWSDEMPRPLREGFLKTLHAFGAGANGAGRMTFRDGTPITLKQIARAACVDAKDARRYVDAARAAGLISMAGERKRGSTPVYAAVCVDSPNWAAAVAHLEATRPQPKRRTPKVWEEDPGMGDAPASSSEGGTGDAPPSENGGCTPERKGDAPGTSQGYPWNYPKTDGGGRQATTGSGGSSGSGSAAQDDEPESEVPSEAIRCVIAMYPAWLRKQLERACHTMPDNVVGAIRAELANGVTVPQLVARIDRRWVKRRFEDDALSSDGRGINRLVGVAIALVKRDDCPHPLCDDGTDLATGEPCRSCERTREDRSPAAPAYTQGAFPVSLEGGSPSTPRPSVPAPRTRLRDCENPECRTPFKGPADLRIPAGPCPACRAEKRKAENS